MDSAATKHCYMCEKDFKIGKEFKDHWKMHEFDIKMSNSLKDSCKIRCNMCDKSLNLCTFRLHITREHDISQVNYKKRYSLTSWILSEKVLHKCALCNDLVLLDSERLRYHMQTKHRGDKITWQEYQVRHMSQEKENCQKDRQNKENEHKIESRQNLNKITSESQQSNGNRNADTDELSKTDEENLETRKRKNFDNPCVEELNDNATIPVKLESADDTMEDPLKIYPEVLTNADDSQITFDSEADHIGEELSTAESAEANPLSPNATKRPKMGSKDVVVCPKCPRKFFLTTQLVHMRDNLRCHIGLLHFSNELAGEAIKVFDGTQCKMCDFASEKNDKRKRHLIYKHTDYVTQILEITDTTIKSFIEAKSRKMKDVVENNESLKNTNGDTPEIEIAETLEDSAGVEDKNGKTARSEKTPDNRKSTVEITEKRNTTQRLEPKELKDLTSLVKNDPQLIEKFRNFVTRIQKKDSPGIDLQPRKFSAIELVLQLDTVKMRERAK